MRSVATHLKMARHLSNSLAFSSNSANLMKNSSYDGAGAVEVCVLRKHNRGRGGQQTKANKR